ncbi:MAG: hypothetical protein ACKO1F_03850 [Flammeovirgaceae bacterium]
MQYPWYETLQNSGEIRQGDFVSNCPIIIPPDNFNLNDAENGDILLDQELVVKSLNVVVVSQSCDLENEKVEIVLVCPYYSLEYFFENVPQSDRAGKGRQKKLEALKQGNIPSYHLLNRSEENGISDFLVVDFKNVYGVNFGFLKSYIKTIHERQRLLPPYREHLSQAFARFFMRVGLPSDIANLA